MFTAPPLPLSVNLLIESPKSAMSTKASRARGSALSSRARLKARSKQGSTSGPWTLIEITASGRTVGHYSSNPQVTQGPYDWGSHPQSKYSLGSFTQSDVSASGKIGAIFRWDMTDIEAPSKVYVRIFPEARASSTSAPGTGSAATGGGRVTEDNGEGTSSLGSHSFGPKYKEVAGGPTITIPGTTIFASATAPMGYQTLAEVNISWQILPQFLLFYYVGDQVPANYRKGTNNQPAENKHDKDGKQSLDVAMTLGIDRRWHQIADFGCSNPDYSQPEYDWLCPGGLPGSVPPSTSYTGPIARTSMSVDVGEDPGLTGSSNIQCSVTDDADGEAPRQENTLDVKWHFPYEEWESLRNYHVWDEPRVVVNPPTPETCAMNESAR